MEIPGYRIVRELGRGGMGTVFLAVQDSLGREIALKLLAPQFVADAVSTERFLHEGRIGARLAHRHIVSIYDIGVHAEQPYLAMEYMPGGAVKTGIQIAPSAALEIVRQIALALDYAAGEGVIHRDLKPENILRRKDGSYALSDFGIARALRADGTNSLEVTQEGTTVGTPHYMSPEQLQAHPLDGRSDLYSLGVVLYQLLMGQLPYLGTKDMPVGMQQIHSPVPRLSEDLVRYQPLIDSMMAKAPERRPGRGVEVASTIEAIQTNPGMAVVTQGMDTLSSARRKPWFVAAGLAIALAGAVGYFALTHQSAPMLAQVSAAKASSGVPADVPKVAEPSVAVLPLVNASKDPEQQFFSDGLSENLIDTLSRFDGLKVIGRTSAFQFRDSKDNSATIGAKLGVAYLLSGSVQRAGDLVRISASLVKAADGSTLWAEHYDRPYKNLFALQDEIAQAVAGAMHVKLLSSGAVASQDDRPPGGSIEAYNAYLQGLKYWHNEEFPKAAEYMTQAVQLDPGYAMAWAQLSGSWSTVAAFQNEAPEVADEHMRIARNAADKALQLAPELGPAHAARAYLDVYHFDHNGALAGCRRAEQLAPKDGTVLNGCGYLFFQVGKLGEAIPLRARLLTTDPLYTVNYLQYANLLMAAGRLDEAEKYLRTADSLPQPNPFWRQKILFSRMSDAMMRGDAKTAMEFAAQMPARYRDQYTALAAQAGPDRAAADTALANALASKGKADANPYLIAQIYAVRGDATQSMEWLQRASAGELIFLPTDPLIMNLRDDPRFIAFCQKVGLPQPRDVETLSIDQIRAAVVTKI
ncbi:MAG: protein kinase [Proteobacteria bacterium]|nr:protein kinase [Pseudomonadota bacterium]